MTDRLVINFNPAATSDSYRGVHRMLLAGLLSSYRLDLDLLLQPRRSPIEPWHPPVGATLGDLAASYTDALTPDQLFDLPQGSIFLVVDEGFDSVERTFFLTSIAAYRVVSGQRVDCCYPRDDPFEDSEPVTLFAREARLGLVRLVRRGEGGLGTIEVGPAPFTLDDLRRSRTESAGALARCSGWSAYEDD